MMWLIRLSGHEADPPRDASASPRAARRGYNG
jgi:hypothetical protein